MKCDQRTYSINECIYFYNSDILLILFRKIFLHQMSLLAILTKQFSFNINLEFDHFLNKFPIRLFTSVSSVYCDILYKFKKYDIVPDNYWNITSCNWYNFKQSVPWLYYIKLILLYGSLLILFLCEYFPSNVVFFYPSRFSYLTSLSSFCSSLSFCTEKS